MKIVRFKTVGGKSLVMISLLLMAPMHIYSSDTFTIQEKTRVHQQTVQLTGVVLDIQGFPLVGVNIMENATNGTITDIDGKFSIKVTPQSVLHVSYIGYVTQTVKVGNKKNISIVMEEDSKTLEEVVVVGYGSQKKVSVTGAVAAIQTKELKQSSAANLSTALAGRMPGLTAMQTSGRPGGDDVTLYLRGAGTVNGSNPLILIDGVPRDNISTMDPNEIASVSILKDASATAVFGVRGANGVIMITTRRGEEGKSELSISADYSLQRFTAEADRIHSWEFAELRNQAFRNDGYAESDLPFTDYMIEMYRSGKDRVYYPDRDVYNEFFKKWAPQTRVNVNLSGGTKKLSYFMNVAYMGQGGQFRTESEKDLGYDPSYKSNRYNFRTNLDYKVASNFKLSLNIASYLEKVNTPQTAKLFNNSVDELVTNMRAYIWATPPTDPGPLTVAGQTLADGTNVPAGQVINQAGIDRNTYGELSRRGYQQATRTNLNSSIIADWGLDFITKGLSTKLMISFDTKAMTTLQGFREYDTYGVTVARTSEEKSYVSKVRMNTNDAISLTKSQQTNYYLNMQYSLNYARQFGLHDVTGMALIQRDNWQQYAADLPYNMLGISARATYSYDSRYLAEVNVGYNGSEQFAKGNASRKPSATRLKLNIKRAITTIGGMIWYGCVVKLLNPSEISEPSEHCGTGIPRPTKLKNASVKIAVGMENITCVMIGPMIFGRTSLKIIKKFPAPSVRDASTNSCSFNFSISALAIRLMPTHSVSINAKIMVSIPGCSTSNKSVTITRRGIPFATSRNRCMNISTFPPKYPEISP